MQNFGRENAHALLGTWKPGSLTLTKFIAKQLPPPQKLPQDIPIKIAIIEKIESAQGTMGRGKRREPLFLPLFPLSIMPRALSFSFSPACPQHKAACAGERGKTTKLEAVLFVALFPYKV